MNKPKPKGESQRAKFVEKARELGCEEDEKIFDKKLTDVVVPESRNNKEKDK